MSKRTASKVLFTLDNRAEAATLLDLARRQYTMQPDAPAVIFIAPTGEEQVLTTRQFFDGAASYAQALQAAGICPRDLVILVMDHSPALLYAFWGALLIGAIPSIFPFLSDKLDPPMYFTRVKALVSHSGARAVIASEGFTRSLVDLLYDGGTHVISESQLQPILQMPTFEANIDADDIAFLQHSSGTTGLQKGVALSHRAVLNQIASYSAAIRLNAEDKIASWLPLYHDMGLIAGFVLPITQGIPLILMSPFHWVRDPKVLLMAVQAHRATLCWLPNFAYNFMALRTPQTVTQSLDLSSMRAFINCSEPMSADSHRRFLERFAPCGLRPHMLATCYAMAENTFAVTQGGIEGEPTIDLISRAELSNHHRAEPINSDELSIEMLSCGKPISNCEVKILDEAKAPLPERAVGEVAVRSDCMLSGYYKRDDISEQALFDGWYLTGDLGYLTDGELYITGRKKDLIIVGGKNIYPQDLELIASKVPGVHAGRTVAFGIPDERLGTEAVVLVCEVDTEDEAVRAEIGRQIRMQIVQQTETAVQDILLVDAKWLHKTSSGKIARGANREKYLTEMGIETPSQ